MCGVNGMFIAHFPSIFPACVELMERYIRVGAHFWPDYTVHILATQAVSWSSKGPFWHGSWYGRPSPGCTPAKTAQAQEEADYSRQWRPKARRGAWLCFAR
uniref:Uncharacterized protein n=1 Tax=Xenopus tropicalis TaxID=8364 RepID=A0A1B8Y2E0_XENTR